MSGTWWHSPTPNLYRIPLSSLVFSRLEDMGSKVHFSAFWNSGTDRQKGETQAHSAVAPAFALSDRWEIMKAILDRSEQKACGECSKWMDHLHRERGWGWSFRSGDDVHIRFNPRTSKSHCHVISMQSHVSFPSPWISERFLCHWNNGIMPYISWRMWFWQSTWDFSILTKRKCLMHSECWHWSVEFFQDEPNFLHIDWLMVLWQSQHPNNSYNRLAF